MKKACRRPNPGISRDYKEGKEGKLEKMCEKLHEDLWDQGYRIVRDD